MTEVAEGSRGSDWSKKQGKDKVCRSVRTQVKRGENPKGLVRGVKLMRIIPCLYLCG